MTARSLPTHIASLMMALLAISTSAQSPVSASPREQFQQYVTQLQANPADDALRTKVIQLALTLDPKPADPPDLLETIGAATYAFKNAQSEADMTSAADLFAKALLLAPWRADLYFNEGVALEKAKHLDEAIKAYRFYLMASPNATDADDVKERIGALKYQVSKAQDQERAAEQQRQFQQQAEAAAESQRAAAQRLEGRYIFHWHREGHGHSGFFSTDYDRVLDIRDGQVTYGATLTSEVGYPELANLLGVYQRSWAVPFNGAHFHYEDRFGAADGTISENGTVTVVFAGEGTTETEVFVRR